ncbi:MAG: acyl carrier protein [Chitinophagaceae bacterium]
MGLDSVEILMKVEDTFGIKIPDEEAQQILTVGDFHNAVWRYLSGKQSSECQSQKLFYTLRRSFVHQYGFPAKELSIATSPDQVFPRLNRRREYGRFSIDTDLQLPDLVLGKSWQLLLTSFGFVSIIGGLLTSLILIFFSGYSNWMFLIPVIGIVSTVLFAELLNPKRTVIGELTMEEFTQQVLALNYSKLVKAGGTNRREMESVINHIIADSAGLHLEDITVEKKIADDLGID